MNGRRQNNPEESGAFFPMLQRNLLYTAVTRERRRVVLGGSRKALAIAVANDRSTQRLTGLRRLLVAAVRGEAVPHQSFAMIPWRVFSV